MPPDSKLVAQLRQTIAACGSGRVSRIILYGSQATEEARSDSDFDVLVVERGAAPGRNERLRYIEALRAFPRPVDVWVMGEEELEETKNVVGGIAYPAHKYGIVLQ